VGEQQKKQKLSSRVPTWWLRRTGRPTVVGTPLTLAGF